MEVFIWLLCFILVGGSTASTCEDLDCGKLPFDDFNLMQYRPNEADLIRLCPQTVSFLNCYFNGAKECLGMTVEEIAETGDEVGRIYAHYFLTAKRLSDEFCDEQSTLRKNYLESRECLDSLLDGDNDAYSVCREKGETNVRDFLEQRQNLTGVELGWRELDCLKEPYSWSCFIEQLETTCGEVAGQTFLDIMGYFKNQIGLECKIENPAGLNQSFLEYLGLEGKLFTLYKSIFDMYRQI